MQDTGEPINERDEILDPDPANAHSIPCLPQTDPQLAVQKMGDVIEYYNATFIPVAKSLLMRIGAGKQALKSPPGMPPRS